MSITIDKLRLQRVVDPRTDVNSAERRMYNVFDGAEDVGYVRVFPDGGVNSTSMTFTANPPSARVFVNRRPLVTMKFQITLTGQSAGAGVPLLQAAGMAAAPGVSAGTAFYDAPRAFPIASATQSLQVSMNNDRLSQNLQQYYRATTRYANPVHQQNGVQSLTPTMLDQSLEYSQLDGFARSPLRGYGDNSTQTPRGGFSGCLITRNDSTGAPGDIAIVELNCTEPLFLSPFLFEEHKQDTGFIGLQNMALTFSLGGRGIGPLAGLGAALWSHSSGGSALSGISASVLEASICFSYLTPDAVQVIPRLNNYSYYEPTVYPTTSMSNVAPGATTVLQMNNIQLNSVPSRIFIFASPIDSSTTVSSTDTYFGLEGVNISFDNRDSILANATAYDLFAIAQKNGCNQTFAQWSRYTGGVLALDFGEDIPLRSLQAVGLRGSYNLRMSVNVRNLSGSTITPTLTVLVVAEGVLTIHDGNVTRSVGILNSEDILGTKDQAAIPYHSSGSLYGGSWASFWSGVKNAVSTVARPLLNVAKTVVPLIAPQYSGAVGIADKAAEALGLGLVGGRRISRRQLSHMLR